MRARVRGCHFSLVPMVICGNLYSAIFFRFILLIIIVYFRVETKLLLLSRSELSCDST